MSTPLRVGLYARCSTVGDRQDPESQLLAMPQYAAARGWEVVGEYVDRASATNLRGRTAWKQIVALAGRRRLDVILVRDRTNWSLRCHQPLAHFLRGIVVFADRHPDVA